MVHDGRVGIDCALGTPYDLIILDLMLPGMEGLISVGDCGAMRWAAAFVRALTAVVITDE